MVQIYQFCSAAELNLGKQKFRFDKYNYADQKKPIQTNELFKIFITSLKNKNYPTVNLQQSKSQWQQPTR